VGASGGKKRKSRAKVNQRSGLVCEKKRRSRITELKPLMKKTSRRGELGKNFKGAKGARTANGCNEKGNLGGRGIP